MTRAAVVALGLKNPGAARGLGLAPPVSAAAAASVRRRERRVARGRVAVREVHVVAPRRARGERERALLLDLPGERAQQRDGVPRVRPPVREGPHEPRVQNLGKRGAGGGGARGALRARRPRDPRVRRRGPRDERARQGLAAPASRRLAAISRSPPGAHRVASVPAAALVRPAARVRAPRAGLAAAGGVRARGASREILERRRLLAGIARDVRSVAAEGPSLPGPRRVPGGETCAGRARVLGRRSPGRPQADSAPRHGALVVDAVVVGGLRVEARRVADGGEAADGRRRVGVDGGVRLLVADDAPAVAAGRARIARRRRRESRVVMRVQVRGAGDVGGVLVESALRGAVARAAPVVARGDRVSAGVALREGIGGSETTSTSPRAPPARNARGRQGASESRNTPVHTPPCAEGGRDPDPREGRAPANGCDAPRSVGLDAGASPRSSALGAPPGRGRDSDHSPSPSMAAGGAGARSGRPGLWRAHRTAAFPRAIFRPAGGFINRESAGGPASRTTKSSGR